MWSSSSLRDTEVPVRATCIASSGQALPESCLDEAAGISRDTEFPLTVGASYEVYAITTFRGHAWYYVLDDNRLPYPVWKLAPLFEIDDPSLPADWVVGYVRKEEEDEGYPIISFPEWALDPQFYERLVDGDPESVAVFKARRDPATAGA
jgi:hypothetical protein